MGAETMPVIGDFHRLFPRLGDQESTDLTATFTRLGELVGAQRQRLSVSFQVADGDTIATRFVRAGPEGCRVDDQVTGQPDVVVILDVGTWLEIAAGELSPLEAFGRSRLRACGDIGVAQRFVRAVHEGAGR